MKKIVCEMCDGIEFAKADGMFVCQGCGTKYSAEEAKKLMVEVEGDVQDNVKVENTATVEKYLASARRAKQKEDWKETEKYYSMVEQEDPTNIEAIFYGTFAQVKLAMLEAESREKRQGVFNVMEKSVSIIGDNYNNTNEENQKLLFEIMDDIKGLKKSKIVPTTHLQDYVTKNGYGNVVDRSQVVEDDSLDVTYAMINKVIRAYVCSLANIIVEYSPEPVKKLFVENAGFLGLSSEIHEKVAPHIEGYKTPQQACIEIAKQVKIYSETTYKDLSLQIDELGKTICPMFIIDEQSKYDLRYMVRQELKKTHPDSKALEISSGCYVATCVYGSYDCPEVWTLRRYRDNRLAESWYGRAFVKTYYAISPTLVKWFGHTEWFKKMWKGTLDRMVNSLNENGYDNTPYNDRKW